MGGTKLDNTGLTFVDAAGTQSTKTPSVTRKGIDAGNLAVTNVAGNLAGAKTGTQAPTTSGTAPVLGTDANKVNVNNAATVGDVLNAGWNLQENSVAKDFVKPYDTVNFVNGTGTTANVTVNDGTVANVTYNVNADGKTTEITYFDGKGNTLYAVKDAITGNITYNTKKDGSGQAVKASDIKGSQISAIKGVDNVTSLTNGTTTTVTNKGTAEAPNYVVEVNKANVTTTPTNKPDANNVTINEAGKVVAPKNDNTFLTAKGVADVINNSGWVTNVTTTNPDGTTSTAPKVVNPGDQVDYVNGNGTTAKVTVLPGTDGAADTFKVSYDVNKANVTTAPTDQASGDNITVSNTGKVVAPTNDKVANNTFVTAKGVADVVNSSGWVAKQAAHSNELVTESTGIADSVINPGDNVSFASGKNLALNKTVEASGNTTFTYGLVNNVSLTDKGSLTVGSVSINNAGLNNGGNKITNVAAGTDDTDAVNVSQLNKLFDEKLGVTKLEPNANGSINQPTNGGKLVNATTVANAINNSGWNLQANGDTPSKVSPGNTVRFINGDNINITRNGNSITVATSRDINVRGDLTVAGDTTVNNFTVNPNSTVNMGGNKVQGVAAGVISANSTDAINGSQLYYNNQAIGSTINNVANNLNARINDVADDADAGTASAMATAGIPQAYLPGKSMVAVGASTYRGKQGYAVGFSAISDSGNWIIKGTVSGNSRGHFGATVGAGYQW